MNKTTFNCVITRKVRFPTGLDFYFYIFYSFLFHISSLECIHVIKFELIHVSVLFTNNLGTIHQSSTLLLFLVLNTIIFFRFFSQRILKTEYNHLSRFQWIWCIYRNSSWCVIKYLLSSREQKHKLKSLFKELYIIKLLIFTPSINVNYSLIIARFDFTMKNSQCLHSGKSYDCNYMVLS